MTFAELATVLGVFGATLVVPISLSIVLLRRAPFWLIAVMTAVLLGLVVTWVQFARLWGIAFRYAEANQTVPDAVEAAQDRWAVLSAVGVLMLIGAAVTAFVVPPRTRPEAKAG
jgi:hypothetical protein